MDRATLEALKNEAEKRCTELFNQGQQINTELERSRGDFRTYESLLLNWQDSEPVLPNIIKPVKAKKVQD